MRSRNPPGSRPSKCEISYLRDVEARPLRRFFCIASGRLFGPVRSGRRSFSVLDAIDPTLGSLLSNKVEPEFLADDTGKKAPDRMLLPFPFGDDRCDRCPRCPPHPCNDAGIL